MEGKLLNNNSTNLRKHRSNQQTAPTPGTLCSSNRRPPAPLPVAPSSARPVLPPFPVSQILSAAAAGRNIPRATSPAATPQPARARHGRSPRERCDGDPGTERGNFRPACLESERGKKRDRADGLVVYRAKASGKAVVRDGY